MGVNKKAKPLLMELTLLWGRGNLVARHAKKLNQVSSERVE
jgi:hypothetical protein